MTKQADLPQKAAGPATRAGFSILDMMLALGIFTILLATFGGTVTSMVRSRQNLETETRLHTAGAEAIRSIVSDLRRSGRVTVNGLDYPFLFTDGESLDVNFAEHDHEPATNTAIVGDWDFGPNREIVFLQPADADFDGRPDVDANGELEWSDTEVSYVVVTDENGVNHLQRRENGDNPTNVVSDVSRIVFDDFDSSGFEVPLDSVRVQVFFRATDAFGMLHKQRVQATVRLRNGL